MRVLCEARARRVMLMVVASLVLSLCVVVSRSGEPADAIEGGEVVGDVPTWAALVLVNFGPVSSSTCSGALIAPSVVLTAAHCVVSEGGSVASPSSRRVVIGRGDLNGSGGAEYGVSRIVVHERYSPGNKVYDAALIVLAGSSKAWPLPVAPAASLYSARGVTLYGYGTVDAAGNETRELRRTPDHAYRLEPCQSGLSAIWVCFNRQNASVNVLPGDSGAPWVVWERGGWVLGAVHHGGGPAVELGTSAFVLAEWLRANAGIVRPEAGRILRDPSTGATWRITSDGFRASIPTGGDFECFVAQGARVVNLPREVIEQLPLAAGTLAKCSSQVSDRDLDGVPDPVDRCPDQAGPAANDGCESSSVDLAVRRVVNTGGVGVRLRATPSLADVALPVVVIPEGGAFRLLCQTWGDAVGPYQNRIWGKVDYAGRVAFVPDTYMDTPNRANELWPAVPACQVEPPPSPQLAGAAEARAESNYRQYGALRLTFPLLNGGSAAFTTARMAVAVVNPAGAIEDVGCAGGDALTIATGQQWTCSATVSLSERGRYSVYLRWRLPTGEWTTGQPYWDGRWGWDSIWVSEGPLTGSGSEIVAADVRVGGSAMLRHRLRNAAERTVSVAELGLEVIDPTTQRSWLPCATNVTLAAGASFDCSTAVAFNAGGQYVVNVLARLPDGTWTGASELFPTPYRFDVDPVRLTVSELRMSTRAEVGAPVTGSYLIANAGPGDGRVLPMVAHDGYPGIMSTSCEGANYTDFADAGVLLRSGESFRCQFSAVLPLDGHLELRAEVYDIGLVPFTGLPRLVADTVMARLEVGDGSVADFGDGVRYAGWGAAYLPHVGGAVDAQYELRNERDTAVRLLPSVSHSGYAGVMSTACEGVDYLDMERAGVVLEPGASFVCRFRAEFPVQGVVHLRPEVYDLGPTGTFQPVLISPSWRAIASMTVGPTRVPYPPEVGAVSVTGRTASVPVDSSSDGGSPVTQLRVTCRSSNGGTTRSSTAPGGPVTVTSLTAGKSYTCRATATNRVGVSTWSEASPSFIVPTKPPAPTTGAVSVAGRTALVPVMSTGDGGSPITAFKVTCRSSNGGTTRSASGSEGPVAVTLLTAGKTYRCAATATNAVGTSAASAASPQFKV